MSSAVRQSNEKTPESPGLILRPRLMRKLQGILDHKLMIVSAPPGYGKTTLVTQFANQSPYPVLWHTVEERERDLPNLYQRVRTLLKEVLPPISHLPDSNNRSPNELGALVADTLREETSKPVIYVFDDLQHLSGAYDAETWLRTLVSLLPGNFHLILISRTLPNLPLAEMIARREVLAIGPEELRFTPQETYQLAERASETNDSTLSAEDVQKLISHLEGWPAGTVFALYPLPEELERLMLGGRRGPEALFDLLANSMLRSQPPRLRHFLLASSTLSRLTPELCSEALGLSDSLECFAEFQIRNLFLSRTPNGLQYHALFRNFLQRQLRTHDPDEYTRLHTRVARWYEKQGLLEEAFEHYISAGLNEQAAALAEKSGQSYFAQGQTETLLNWHTQLSQAGVHAPQLSYVCAVIHTDRYAYAEAETLLDQAEQGFERDENHEGLLNIRLQRAILDLQRGHYETALAGAQDLLANDASLQNLRGRALKVLGVTQLRLGQIEEALDALQQAVPLHRMDGDAYTLANILQDLGVAYWQTGRTEDAKACLQEVVALRRSLGGAEALALALNNLGCLYHSAGSYDQARQTFEQGLNAITKIPHGRAEAYLMLSLGDLTRDLGAFDEAANLYRRALEMLGSSEPVLHCLLLISLSTLQRWNERPDEATELAQEALAKAEQHQIAYEKVAAQVAWWAARVAQGDTGEALPHLVDLSHELHRLARLAELTQVLALSAWASLIEGQPDDADDFLQQALTLAQETGTLQLLAAEAVHNTALYQYIQQNLDNYRKLLLEMAHLRDSLRQAPHIQQRAQATRILPQHTYSLRVHTFGIERIERDGSVIPASEWRTITAQELFLYLLFVGPQTRERISLVFWPDSSTKRVRSSFHTTLYRARQALGENVISYEDGVYAINPEVGLWCDAREMEKLTEQARLLPSRDPRTEDLWQRAVELYQGDFLPSIDADWIAPYREGYHETYLDALVGLGDCSRARSDMRGAIQAYKRALIVEPYREDIHRSIMLCYAALGERQLISNQLDEICGLLWDELGIEPSDETLQLAEQLLR